MNNSQVAHLWANQSKEEKYGSHFYFEGATIYSYGKHFPIAQFVQNARGERAVLFTRDTYGITTAKHVGLVHRALDGLNVPVFYVPHVDAYVREIKQPEKDTLKDAYKATLKVAAGHANKAKRARKFAQYELEAAQREVQEANALSAFFKLGYRKVTDASVGIVADLAQKIEENRKKEALRKRERERKAREKDQEDFASWQAGYFMHGCPYSYQTDEDGSAYLRTVVREGVRIVETSRGAQVNFEDARRAFRFVKLCKMTGRKFKANGLQVPVGDFAIRSITAEGDVQVGCHFFTWQRIAEFAKATGIFEDAATEEALSQTANH